MTIELANLDDSIAIRFWSKVDPAPLVACWEWLAYKNQDGYGHFRILSRMVKAHRVAFALVHGGIQSGMCIRHACDNPGCCNPAHLKLGSIRDNVLDMCIRGRKAMGYGERNSFSKLTEDLVLEIVASSEGQGTIAKRLGLSRSTICHIRSGRTWSWLTSRYRAERGEVDHG